MGRTTIRDVAALAGVSTATVSYVLNKSGSVSTATAARVRACVDELGYRPNILARAQRTGRSGAIGLAVADLTNPFFPEFAQGVHEAAAAAGYGVFLIDAGGSHEAEAKGVEMLADRVPEGLIWCPVGGDEFTARSFPFPTLTFDREIDGFDSINADVYRGGQLQAEYVESYGHTRVGLIRAPKWSETGTERRAGFVEGLPSNIEIVWEVPMDYSSNVPDDLGQQILAGDVTCVVTANDIQAIGLLQFYRSAGVSVPDDVSVIGFDDTQLSGLVSPGLTSVHLPVRELGARAFEILCERIRTPDGPIKRERLPVSMTVRGSLERLSPQR